MVNRSYWHSLFGSYTKALRTPLILFLFLSYLMISQTWAAQATASETVLWERWYTITLGQKIPYAYYREKLSKKDQRYFFQYEMTKKEDGFTQQENYGAFAQINNELTPQSYNIVKTYRKNTELWDGNYSAEKKSLTLNHKINEIKERPIKKTLSQGAFLSAFFPLWLEKNMAQLKKNSAQPQSFTAIMEETLEYSPGHARWLEPDDYAKKTQTTKIALQFRGQSSEWWLHPDGSMKKMVTEDLQQQVLEVSASEAQSFLKE